MDSAEEKPTSQPTVSHATAARAAILCLLGGLCVLAIVEGLQLRRAEFQRTIPIRYANDVSNGFAWGKLADRTGLFLVYDLYAHNRILFPPNELDYTPLRLTIVRLWANWASVHYPQIRSWQNDYDLTRPMLLANAAAELISSLLIFLLVRLWIVRMDDASRPPLLERRMFRGVGRGFIAALLFWFNPAVIVDGHGFPQWDVWNAPFFLGAVLLVSLDGWFAAGCCVVVGAFLKGQILLVAPIFLIWPLVRRRWEAALKFVGGFGLAGMVLAFPWMRPGPPELRWLILLLLAIALTVPIALRWRMPAPLWIAALIAAALLLAWPWGAEAEFTCRVLPLILIALLATARFAPPRLLPTFYALAIAGAVALIMPLFGASTAWFEIGFDFGTRKLMWMATDDTFNLPEVLRRSYAWSNNPRVLIHVPILGAMEFRSAMLACYALCLVLCGICAAIHEKRNDTRFLAAMVAPWLCWFVLLTQLNNRYLIWASGFSALLVAVGLGMTLLGIIVSLIGWAGIMIIMCGSGGDPALARILRPLTPHLAWPLMLAAAVYLWIAVWPTRRHNPLSRRGLATDP